MAAYQAHFDTQTTPANVLDRAIAGAAATREEAVAWGLPLDEWRAHLGPSTWPEVLRQYALAAGWGPRRPRPKRTQVGSSAASTGCRLVLSIVSMPWPLPHGPRCCGSTRWLLAGGHEDHA